MHLPKAHGESEFAYALNEKVYDNSSQGGLCSSQEFWVENMVAVTSFAFSLPIKDFFLRTEKKIERKVSGMALVAPLCFPICSTSDFLLASSSIAYEVCFCKVSYSHGMHIGPHMTHPP